MEGGRRGYGGIYIWSWTDLTWGGEHTIQYIEDKSSNGHLKPV